MPNLFALAATAIPQRLHALDLCIVAAYLVGITVFGLQFRKRSSGQAADRSLKSYFLANNTIPWWAIALSIVSAETSTVTIISVPGLAFAGDFGFLQVALGYMVGRVVVAALFLPRYFAGEMLTAYQLIDRRFGPVLHKVTAGLFLLTRAAAEGVRVFAVSIVVGIAIGTRDVLSIAIISALTLLYTFEGGMAAVIWTDVVQMAIYVGGTVVAVTTLGSHVTGGWSQIHAVAGAAGKFHMLHFALNLTQSYTFWAGLLGGTFLTMASHGTDQLMVQRLLAARNLRQSQAALLSSGVVIFAQFAMFLLIGAGLYVFYGQHPEAAMKGMSPDKLFPTFIVREMPVGVAGLLVAAILAAAMSNLSAALNSLSSTTVVDFYVRLRPRSDDRERALVSKASTVMWALVLFAIAVYTVSVNGKGNVVEIALSIAAVAYGCLLGVFLLGTLTKFANEAGTSVGMVCGFALNLWLWRGTFPVRVGPVTIPHIAFTWYVLIGAVATFVLGAAASLVTRASKPRVLAMVAMIGVAATASAQSVVSPPDFSSVSKLVNDAVAAKKLPGAVVVVGHGGRVVFEQAYGARKLAGEPGLDGLASDAEPMTADTIFDMASLTKCLATATAVMQLYEQGKVEFDAPLEKYLPAFNATHDAQRARVTLRMLLTHTSGEPADVDLKDAWGLVSSDKAEGFRRAETTPLRDAPGALFRYSDINFILLGEIVETLGGQPEDVYAEQHIFAPLGMTETRYLPAFKACGPRKTHGAAIAWAPKPPGRMLFSCTPGTWSTRLFERIAPTTHDNEGTTETNPDFDYLLRGTVHDPTTRRMGGVAGQAGVFSTAHDVALFAQALLDKLTRDAGPFPLTQATLRMMTSPQQPRHSAGDVTGLPSESYPSRVGHHVRAFGWDIDSDFSRPRGTVFPVGSFGHTGFTGTSLWMDPASGTYVILLANAIHPRGNPPISHLRGDVATAAAKAVGAASQTGLATEAKGTSTGIDVVEADRFAEFKALTTATTWRVGLLTNQTGVDARGRSTVDILANDLPRAMDGARLVRLFSPEHGLLGKQDSTTMKAEKDAASSLPVTELYGPHDADKRPSHEQLKDLDAVVIDLQDAGMRFFTYETVLGYFLEAAGREKTEFHHALRIVVLDRPAMLGGEAVQGPVSDAGREEYTNYSPVPVRLGMTFGELARYDNAVKSLGAELTVVALKGWTRAQFYDETGLPWVNPSPNLRSMRAAVAYPGVALLEFTNASVGRGTETPYEVFGAGVSAKDGSAWFKGSDVAVALNARAIPGVRFEATTVAIAEDTSRYPFHGQTMEAVRLVVTDRTVLDSPEMGVEILSVLHKLYPTAFALGKAKLVANQSTMDAIMRGDDPRDIAAGWQPRLEVFKKARAAALLY